MTAPDCPRINVNPKKCDDALTCVSSEDECKAAPILIPCPIPRTVEFQVALECPCDLARCDETRRLKVACSISGESWEDTEVEGVDGPDNWKDAIEERAALRIASERWALVKALVLGSSNFVAGVHPGAQNSMMLQRDAVFSVLADMARAEDAISTSRQRAYDAMDGSGYTADSEHMRARSTTRESVDVLAAYVEYLVEQVGVLL